MTEIKLLDGHVAFTLSSGTNYDLLFELAGAERQRVIVETAICRLPVEAILRPLSRFMTSMWHIKCGDKDSKNTQCRTVEVD